MNTLIKNSTFAGRLLRPRVFSPARASRLGLRYLVPTRFAANHLLAKSAVETRESRSSRTRRLYVGQFLCECYAVFFVCFFFYLTNLKIQDLNIERGLSRFGASTDATLTSLVDICGALKVLYHKSADIDELSG